MKIFFLSTFARRLQLFAVVAAFMLAPSLVFAQTSNLIVNGSFENGTFYPVMYGSWVNVSPGDTNLTGWSVGMNPGCDGAVINWHNQVQMSPVQDGTKVVDLNFSGQGLCDAGTISQTFATTPGTQYQLAFYLSGPRPNSGSFPNPRCVRYRLSFVEATDITGSACTPSSPNLALTWEEKNIVFTAASSSTTLTFSSVDGSGYWGPVLDDVRVTGPECDTAAIVSIAEGIRDRVVAEARNKRDEISVSCNEYNILFEAVSRRMGVPTNILKAYAFGEGLANYYVDRCPRHFLQPSLRYPVTALNHELCSRYVGSNIFPVPAVCETNTCPAPEILRSKLDTMPLPHTAVGRDADSFGFGIMQVTLKPDSIVEPLFMVHRATQLPGNSCDHVGSTFPSFAPLDWIHLRNYSAAGSYGPYPVGVEHDLRLCPIDQGCIAMPGCSVPPCNNGNISPVDTGKLVQDPLYNIIVGAQMMIYKSFWTENDGRVVPKHDFMDYFDEAEWPGYGRIIVAGPKLLEASEGDWIHYAADLKGTPKDCIGLPYEEWDACRKEFMKDALAEDFPNEPVSCAP